MKTALQNALKPLAPSISIVTHWEQDPDCGPISGECDGFDSSEDGEWEAWQSEIRATAILDGEEITGSAYLGGTWERIGDNPAVTNPEISGYENGMTREALEEIRKQIETMDEPPFPQAEILLQEIAAAMEHLKADSLRAYEEQQAAR